MITFLESLTPEGILAMFFGIGVFAWVLGMNAVSRERQACGERMQALSNRNALLFKEAKQWREDSEYYRRRFEELVDELGETKQQSEARRMRNIDMRCQLNQMVNTFNGVSLVIRELMWIAFVFDAETMSSEAPTLKARRVMKLMGVKSMDEANAWIADVRERAKMARKSLKDSVDDGDLEIKDFDSMIYTTTRSKDLTVSKLETGGS